MNFVLFLIFIVLIIAIGGDRGVMSLVALLGNVIVFFSSVYIMKYNDPYKLVLFDIVFMCLLTLIYQNGVNIKTMSSLVSVVIVAVVLMYISKYIGHLGNMGGYNEFEMYEDTLMNLSVNIKINLPDVAVAMLVLGVTGALIDIAVAVTSSVYEVWKNNTENDEKTLITTGMHLGKSILGSTINTLWFACVGEFLLMFLLFRRYEYSFVSLINSKAFFDIIANIMLSATGCCAVVPVATYVLTKMTKWDRFAKHEAESTEENI
ncbi:MAG: YibE/F family protein [Lachnospiraceae bacterium]|nr:YibE/F family protein [Lachnospiraceae bacterium]